MSDTSPHIRHRVQMPDGKHIEVVYRDQRRPAEQLTHDQELAHDQRQGPSQESAPDQGVAYA